MNEHESAATEVHKQVRMYAYIYILIYTSICPMCTYIYLYIHTHTRFDLVLWYSGPLGQMTATLACQPPSSLPSSAGGFNARFACADILGAGKSEGPWTAVHNK